MTDKHPKISIKELKPDDWIRIGDANPYHGHYGRILAVNAITGYCIVAVRGKETGLCNVDVFIEDIEPVPITEEILLKFNFVRDANNKDWFKFPFPSKDDGIYIAYDNKYSDVCRVEAGYGWGIFECLYVHTLQHAIEMWYQDEILKEFTL